MARSRISRRGFVKSVGLVTLGTSLGGILAACQPKVVEKVVKETQVVVETPVVEKAVTATPAPLKGKVIGDFGGWTPTESMERSQDNPNPHNKLNEVIADYKALHPEVEVEWIRIPTGVDGREWMIAQQSAGTIPHIVGAPQWVIKEDLEKNWWVNLTPYLDQPNPYIPAGDPGSQHWLDQFYPTPNSMLLMQGSYFNVCYGINTTWFFYNVDLFDELGIKAPQSYREFLDNCKVIKDAGLIAYDFITWGVVDSDSWYRQQLGSMILARDIEPKVNPDRGVATLDEVACAIKRGDYSAQLPQFRQWMELWKANVPYRKADWAVPAQDPNRLFLTKKTPVLEQGCWIVPQLEVDPMMDFEWATFWAPTLTKESSGFVTDPPTPAPNVGTVTNHYAVATRAMKDGVLEPTVDFLRFLALPENVAKVQQEIGTDLPNVKGVKVVDRYADAFKWLVESLGYVTMFQYENCTMDQETAVRCVKAWFAYLLDQMTIDQAIQENDTAMKEYADRYVQQNETKC